MKRVPKQTARVNWRLGQPLLPDHFLTQESVLRRELHERVGASSAPSWGLVSLRVDGFQLVRGILSVQEMLLVTEGGLLVDVPGNCGALSLNLAAAGTVSVTVYAQVFAEPNVLIGEGQDPVERAGVRAALSSEPFADGVVESFRLAEFTLSPEGSWMIAPSYLPPALHVTTIPHYDDVLTRLEVFSRSLLRVLEDEIHEEYLAAEAQSSASEAYREALFFSAFLTNTRGDYRPHPFELHRELQRLATQIAIFRAVAVPELRPYLHDDPASSVLPLVERLEELLQMPRTPTAYAPFRAEGGLLVCELPKEVRRARQVYLLIQKPHVSTKLEMQRTKLAAKSRIQLIHEKALRGIPFEPLERPPFHHTFTSTVDFFTIGSGEEWDHAIRDSAVALFDEPTLDGCRLFVHWRMD